MGKLKAASGRLRENRAGSSAWRLGVVLWASDVVPSRRLRVSVKFDQPVRVSSDAHPAASVSASAM